jgi:hypothetical protein
MNRLFHHLLMPMPRNPLFIVRARTGDAEIAAPWGDAEIAAPCRNPLFIVRARTGDAEIAAPCRNPLFIVRARTGDAEIAAPAIVAGKSLLASLRWIEPPAMVRPWLHGPP